MHNYQKQLFCAPTVVRRLLLSWLLAATISYGVLPASSKNLHALAGIANMSFLSVLIMTAIFYCAFSIAGRYWKQAATERWLLVAVFCVLAAMCLYHSFSWPFLIFCFLVLLVLICYAFSGWNCTSTLTVRPKKEHPSYAVAVGVLAAAFVIFVSIWTVCRVYSFSTPTYDFGIFSQMFYNMKTSGLPLTTVERDGLLSHFHVHVSPIYYLLLPVYCLIPLPATLQVLQALILASAVIPLWKLCHKHGLSPLFRVFLCALLLVYPAYSGGTSYDIHENAFLTPLILWLLYGIDQKSIPLTIIFSCLTLLVKEDAAVYVAVIALYLLIHGNLRKDSSKNWDLLTGSCLLIGSVIWFVLVTGFLSEVGDGVMTGRYRNFMYDDSDSLVTVIKAVILCPMKVLFESVDQEKLKFVLLTLLPLLGLPFFTRRYERYIFLIPYFLVNLMSDYQYQHDIFFQYTYGATAFLFYLTIVNLADLRANWVRYAVGLLALICSIFCFTNTVLPKAVRYPKYCMERGEYYSQIRETLSQIPDDASVSATTFYTTFLSQRETLYDVKYTSIDHLLSTEYVALAVNEKTSYTQYTTNGENGYETLVQLLESMGYVPFAQIDETLLIYRKP